MIWYVAFVSLLNLGLGFALAVYLNAARDQRRPAPVVAAAESTSYDEFDDSDEYYSDEHYEESEDMEYESATAG